MSKAQTLIEQFYQEEIERKAQEATFTPLDVTVSSADMAVISTISKRFSKDKNLLVREAIGQALLDMFSALDPVERKILAKDADELAKSIATEIAEEQGLDSLEISGTNWVQQDKNCVKEERKAEKELAQQQAMAAKMVLSPDTSTEDTSSSQEPELHTTEADTEDDSSAPLESSDTSESPEATEETSEQETDSKSIFG